MTIRLIILAAVLSALSGAGWYIDTAAYRRGVRDVQNEVHAAASAAEQQNAAVQRKQFQTLLESKDAQNKKLQIVSADHGRALRELERLRIAARSAGGGAMPSPPAGTGTDNTYPVEDLLGRCGAELVRVAQAADAHAADALMCIQAWPRSSHY